jgi:hypothetical protein
MSYKDDIILALNLLGGVAHNQEIYAKVREIRKGDLVENWEDDIRATIQRYSSDASTFGKGEDIFYSRDGVKKRSGYWGLRNAYLDKK